MPDWGNPGLLLLLALVPLLRWLHRRREVGVEIAVSALFLWPREDAPIESKRRHAKPDPRWRMRALIAALLVIAAAAPFLPASAPRPLDIWVDDSPSMWTREDGATRLELGARLLADALAETGARPVRLIALHQRGSPLEPAVRDARSLASAVSGWLTPGRSGGRLPEPLQLDELRDHWLISDGADPAVLDWARRSPLSRVIPVGRRTENAAITRLALRPQPEMPERLAGVVQVTNAGTRTATRRLEVRAGPRRLVDEQIEIPAGGRVQHLFEVRGPLVPALRASIGPADALLLDDSLVLAQPEAERPGVYMGPQCGPDLTRAISVHGGVREAPADRAALVIGCSPEPPAGSRATLWLRPPTSEGPAAGSMLVATRGRTLEAQLPVDAAQLARGPEYPVLVAGLLDRALGRPLLDRRISVERAEGDARIVPALPKARLRGDGPSSAERADSSTAILLLALGLLALDTWHSSRSAARVLLLGVLAVCIWNPAWLPERRPVDVIVLLDDSLSVDRSALERAWAALVPELRALPGQSRLSVLRFAAGTSNEAERLTLESVDAAELLGRGRVPRRGSLDSSQSDVGRALGEAFARIEPDRPARVVLVSDGADTQGGAEAGLRDLRSAGVPVVAMYAVASAPEGDAWIAHLEAPREARAGDVVRISARVIGPAGKPAELRLRVNGRLAAKRALVLPTEGPARVSFELTLHDTGPHRLDAELDMAGDPRSANDRLSALVDVRGAPSVRYLTTRAGASPLLRSLRGAGWQVEGLHPSSFSSHGPPPSLLVLDDVSIGDMQAAAWNELVGLVRHEGSGLLVLGGPHSFAAGGYRHSRLEELLPVTAESRERSGAALYFLVDVSGSMESDRLGRSRLALARAALFETIARLGDADQVGVASFATQPREILPLGRHANPAARIGARLPAASGGTALRPALEHARARLAEVEADQRLIVLVTDGFVEAEDLTGVERELAALDVDVIALALGADVELSVLERLAARGAGVLLRVDEAASLPRLMVQEVGARLEPARIGSFRPRPLLPLPFEARPQTWPELRGYMISRPRARARVALASERGDPLLATSTAGAGRVAVLPGGLGAWASAWPAWSDWSSFVGGLAHWLARPGANPRIHARFTDTPGGLGFAIDALEESGAWSTPPEAHITLVDATGGTRKIAAPPRAPGRYEGVLPTTLTGVHRIAVQVGDEARVGHVLRSAPEELGVDSRGAARLAEWADAGLLELWADEASADVLRAPRRHLATPTALALFTLVAWVGLLVWEETPFV